MKSEVVLKLREMNDNQLAVMLITLMCRYPEVEKAAAILMNIEPAPVTFKMLNTYNNSIVNLTMTQAQLDTLIAEAPSFGENKVAFIKRIREVTGTFLLESKLFSETQIGKYVKVGWTTTPDNFLV